MNYKMYILLVFALIPFTANAGWFGPSDYDECILKNMKGEEGKTAASLIMMSCRNKFPLQAKKKPVTVNAGWFGPSNYDECILKYMKGMTSRTAASLIMISCRNKFPLQEK